MRVLHLYAGNLYGGIERMLVTIAATRDACPTMSHEFALCFEGRLAQELRGTGATVHMLGDVRFSRPRTVRRARRTLSSILSRERFEVLITHSSWPHVLLAPVVRRAGLPLVFWAHAPTRGGHWLERWARLVTPDHVIANSHYTLSSIPKLFPSVPATVVYCPVVMANQTHGARCEVRRELGTLPESTVIVMASRLEAWKGHRLLLRALSRLSELPGCECWIAGDAQRPSERAYLEELKSRAKGLRVKFLGHRSDIFRVLAAADIHCQPNTGPEPFGIAFVEALATGLPVVTTRLGGATEIVDESCGVLTDAGDEIGLAAALRELIVDPVRRAKLASCGPERARGLCDPNVVLPELQSTLQRVAGRRTQTKPRDPSTLRVLHLYSGNLYGGVERLLVTLACEGRFAPDMEPHFGLCFEGELSRELRSAAVPVHMLGGVRFSRPWTVMSARRRLKQLLQTLSFDVVVCHSAWPHAIFAPVAKIAGLPVVFFAHGVSLGRHWADRAARWHPPTMIIANGSLTAIAAERLFPGAPCRIWFPAIPTPRPPTPAERVRIRATFGTAESAVVIIIFSRLESLKGHDVLIKALGLLRERTDWECWVVGGVQRAQELSYLGSLQSLARSLRLDQRMRFPGQRTDVSSLLAGADIHCQPNTTPEGFGLAFVEAMYARLPVLTSDLGGAKEIVVDGSTGRLLPPGDVGALAAAIKALLDDRAERLAMGEHGRQRAIELCDPAERIPRLRELLSEVAATLPALRAKSERRDEPA